MKDKACDIILPVCDQFEFTKNCIDSIIRKTATPYRLIVINNGKNESTKAYLKEVGAKLGERLVVIENPYNFGWVKALNQGIAISTAPYLCFQNDDTVVTEGWLDKMIGILEENKNVGIVNPVWEGRPNHKSIDDYGRHLENTYSGQFIETDWARGFCVVLKREVIARIGNIDEIYGLAYFDDVDFSVRAINAGFLVVLALDTYVYHHRNVTFFEVLKGKSWNELHEKNKVIYYRKWGKPLRISIILNGKVCKKEDTLKDITDTVFYLARRQHHLDIFSPRRIDDMVKHTNVRIKCHGPMTPFIASALVYLNGKKRHEKRYDAVFNYGKLSGTDSNSYIKNAADALKEKTKERFGGAL